MVSLRGGNKDKKDKAVRRSGLDKMHGIRQKQADQDLPEQEQPEVEEKIATGQKECVNDDLAISTISPDPTNARRFPVIKPAAESALLARNKGKQVAYVILDKGIFVNKTPATHPLYRHIEKQLSEIIDLAKQIKAGGGLYQSIEVYRVGGMDYRIVYGHRRFYAVVYLVGWDYVWSFKVHRTMPSTPKVRQFVENNARADLALHEKLTAFQSAFNEVVEQNPEANNEKIMELLGIGRSTFFKFKKWIGSDIVVAALEDGIDFLGERQLIPAIKQAEARVQEEGEISLEEALKPEVAKLFIEAGRDVPQYLESTLLPSGNNCQNDEQASADGEEPTTPPKKPSKGRPATNYKTPAIKSTNAIRSLLTEDVTKMELDGVSWGDVDWDDKQQVNERLQATIKALESMMS